MSKKRRPNQNSDVSDAQNLDEELIVELEDGDTSVNSLVYENPEEIQEETVNDVTSENDEMVLNTEALSEIEVNEETNEQHDINHVTSNMETSKNYESDTTDNVPNFRLGQKVMINPDASKDYNGFKLPTFAYRNVYVIKKILNKRVIITSGTYTLAMKINDIFVANM